MMPTAGAHVEKKRNKQKRRIVLMDLFPVWIMSCSFMFLFMHMYMSCEVKLARRGSPARNIDTIHIDKTNAIVAAP